MDLKVIYEYKKIVWNESKYSIPHSSFLYFSINSFITILDQIQKSLETQINSKFRKYVTNVL